MVECRRNPVGRDWCWTVRIVNVNERLCFALDNVIKLLPLCFCTYDNVAMSLSYIIRIILYTDDFYYVFYMT